MILLPPQTGCAKTMQKSLVLYVNNHRYAWFFKDDMIIHSIYELLDKNIKVHNVSVAT